MATGLLKVDELRKAGRMSPAAYLYAARALRDFGDGFVAVLLPVYLTILGLGAFEKSLGQRQVDCHRSSLLSFFNPSCTLWRAESCVVDIAAAISG